MHRRAVLLPTHRLAVLLVLLALLVASILAPAAAHAQEQAQQDPQEQAQQDPQEQTQQEPQDTEPAPFTERAPSPLDTPEDDAAEHDASTDEEPAPEEPAPDEPAPDDADADEPAPDDADADPDAETEPVVPIRVTEPALRRSEIPLGSVLLAVGVLFGGAVLLRRTARAEPAVAQPPPAPPTPLAAEALLLEALVQLGKALVDAGEPVDQVHGALRRVARVNGVAEIDAMVLPTALIVSVADGSSVTTEVKTAGSERLRLDQIDEVFRILQAAERGTLPPSELLTRVEQARRQAPAFPPTTRIVGHTLLTVGLTMILRGGWRELLVAGALGLAIGAFHLATQRLSATYQAFVPVFVAFGVSTVTFTVARLLPELAVFPVLIAPLILLLPGALLTTSVRELATGQIMSGAARLVSGGMQLVLLAIGIVMGAQLVGVPPTTIGVQPPDPLLLLMPWLGVAVFGFGVVRFHGARRESVPWILLVLVVAYAGQVVGGLFFGGALSAFFGALAMTPVAMVAATRPTGPPVPVTFLPGFWVLVPGAVGLVGVTKYLGDDRIGGAAALTNAGLTMVGIALGVLLGLAIGRSLAVQLGLSEQPDLEQPDATRLLSRSG